MEGGNPRKLIIPRSLFKKAKNTRAFFGIPRRLNVSLIIRLKKPYSCPPSAKGCAKISEIKRTPWLFPNPGLLEEAREIILIPVKGARARKLRKKRVGERIKVRGASPSIYIPTAMGLLSSARDALVLHTFSLYTCMCVCEVPRGRRKSFAPSAPDEIGNRDSCGRRGRCCVVIIFRGGGSR